MTQAITRQQAQIAAEREAYTGEPTKRQRAAAAAVNAGKAIEAAMADAGYGKRFIAGHAKTFSGVLASCGLLTEAKAKKATPPAPVPAAAVPTTSERETIR